MKEYQWDYLASQTLCTVESLQRLRAGWSVKRGAYTFPMRNGKKQICGVRLRYPNGTKSSAKGSRNGLFLEVAQDFRGRVFISEGPTDTASLIQCGLCAVGRPSCNTGSKMLLDLLPFGTQVIMVADRDEAGIKGAEQVATNLVNHVREVRIIQPTWGNDANEWVADGACAQLINAVADNARAFRK